MNYYSQAKKTPANWYGPDLQMRGMYCCAAGEACLDYLGGTAKSRIEKVIDEALWAKKTWLNWYLVPSLNTVYKEAEDIIQQLPATQFLGEYKNLNSNRIIRAYVTNLQQEW